MTICNTRCRPFGEVTLPEFIYKENAGYILPTVDAAFCIGLFVAVIIEGKHLQQLNFEDPHFRNIVIWGGSEVTLSALMRLPYIDAKKTALKIALLSYILFPIPVGTTITAWAGSYADKNIVLECLLGTIAVCLLAVRVGTTILIINSSIERHKPEQKPFNKLRP